MTKLASIIGKNEGFGIPGSIPTIRHNPGDLRHSPHSSHPNGPDDVGTIDNDAEGWEDLERQLQIFASRTVTHDPETGDQCVPRLMNLHDLAYVYAPPSDGNPTEAYLGSICTGLGLPETATVADALLILV